MELSFSHKITNQCKIYIGVTNYKETPHNFTYDPTNGNIFILAKHVFFFLQILRNKKKVHFNTQEMLFAEM